MAASGDGVIGAGSRFRVAGSGHAGIGVDAIGIFLATTFGASGGVEALVVNAGVDGAEFIPIITLFVVVAAVWHRFLEAEVVVAAKRLLANIGCLAVVGLQTAALFTCKFIDAAVGHTEVFSAVIVSIVTLVVYQAAVRDLRIFALMVVATGRLETWV